MTRMRKFMTLVLFAIMLIALHDVLAPHGRGWAASGAIFAIDEYREHISPRLRGHVVCRFKPTCSAYGRAAIAKYGFAKGSLLTAWRIARCGPWTPLGTIDPP